MSRGRLKKTPSSSWVTPAFGDFSALDSPVGGSSSTSAASSSKRVKGAGSSRRLWEERFAPLKTCDVAVHHKKIEEVQLWLKGNAQGVKGFKYLLLTGPSGSCKTSTLRVLALELGFDIREWINPIRQKTTTWEEEVVSSFGIRYDSTSEQSQSSQFWDFLVRSTRYRTVCGSSQGRSTCRPLVLVEDMPNSFLRTPSQLHEILRKSFRSSSTPMVFVMSESHESHVRKVFPPEVVSELEITTVNFNPVSQTLMMKAMMRIWTLAQLPGPPPKDALSLVAQNSCGDMRSVVNTLQFSMAKGVGDLKSLVAVTAATGVGRGRKRTRKQRSTTKKDAPSCSAIGGRDVSLLVFHALGKVLHCKRMSIEEDSCGGKTTVEGLGALKEVPETLVEKSHCSPSLFSLFLHHNCPHFFQDIELLTRASGYLADGDLFTGCWVEGTHPLDVYCGSVCTRGVMFSLGSKSLGGWRPIMKPEYLNVERRSRENLMHLRCALRAQCLPAGELVTTYVPFCARLCSPAEKGGVIHNVGVFASHPKCYHTVLEEGDVIEEEEEEREYCFPSVASEDDQEVAFCVEDDEEFVIEEVED